MDDNIITTELENNDPDSAEALLDKYERKSRSRSDDSAAMQAVVCILLAAAMFLSNLRFPEEVRSLLDRIIVLSEDENAFIPNPIDAVLALL